jgi:hypothetical protein
LDHAAGIVFFVINGRRLRDVAVTDAAKLVAPMIGFGGSATTERVRLNFGDSPFKYDHAAYQATVAASMLPADFPFRQTHPHCSWLVTFDSPLELRRTQPQPESNGSALLINEKAFPLRTLPNTKIVYYECQAVDIGIEGHWYFGFGRADSEVTHYPGWTNSPSVGYCARDGHLGVHLLSPAHDACVGPVVKLHDVCGCGLDRDAGIVFFVINGRRLADIAIKDAQLLIAPMVGFGGMATTETVKLNFGDAPFNYDHAAYLQAIAASPLPALPFNFPFRQPHKDCSWLVTFDSPLELRCSMPESGSYGCASLLDRAFFPLRALKGSSPPVLYYELTVLDGGATGSCSFGFGRADTETNSVPGWTNSPSIGYTGAGGYIGCNLLAAEDNSDATAHNSIIGPELTTGDVAGCGIERAAGVVFFVLNGRRLPNVKVKEAELLVAPMVGFGGDATNERVRLNFGDAPFVYEHAAHKVGVAS